MKCCLIRSGLLLSVVLLSARAIAVDKPLADLQGKWKVTKVTVNGKGIEDPQMTNSQLEFGNDELVWESGDQRPRERFKVKPEANSSPPAIHVTRIEPKDRPQQGWQIYELKDGKLRMAFFDALRQRPNSFDPQPKLIVMELEKASAQPN